MRIRVAVVSIVALAVMAYISPPTVSADPVAPTALVLKVVDGDTIDIRDDSRGDFACGFWVSTHRRRRSLVTPSAAGDRRRQTSRSDRYGRTLTYLVRADGWDYSVEAARAGTAHSYVYGGRRPVSRHDVI